MIELTTPVGRLVGGHPMVMRPVKDDKTGLPKMQADGVTQQVQFYMGLAIAKNGETHWNQTEWGAKIWAETIAAWPNGEYQQPTFSFKITDGDSQIPNKKMKKPCDREGYPGHWVINASNGYAVNSYRHGNYNPMTDLIQNKDEIKAGDYCRLVISIKSNKSTQTAGIYVNPSLFELYQSGVAIISENAPDATATLGATAAALPVGALVDTNMPNNAAAGPSGPAAPINTPASPSGPAGPGNDAIAPNTEFVNGPAKVLKYQTADGGWWTREELVPLGYNDVQLAALPQQVM